MNEQQQQRMEKQKQTMTINAESEGMKKMNDLIHSPQHNFSEIAAISAARHKRKRNIPEREEGGRKEKKWTEENGEDDDSGIVPTKKNNQSQSKWNQKRNSSKTVREAEEGLIQRNHPKNKSSLFGDMTRRFFEFRLGFRLWLDLTMFLCKPRQRSRSKDGEEKKRRKQGIPTWRRETTHEWWGGSNKKRKMKRKMKQGSKEVKATRRDTQGSGCAVGSKP